MADTIIKVVLTEAQPIKVLMRAEDGHGTTASINDHRDVEIINPQDKQVLVYEQSSQKFKNKIVPGELEYDSDYGCFIKK